MTVRSRLQAAGRLGDLELGRRRHVCAVFETAADARSTIVRYAVDALARGEQVILIVADPPAWVSAIELEARASDPDRDVAAAVIARRLDVRSWSDAYLRGGAFNAARMLAYVRRSLRASARLEVTAVRLIGDMTWATDGVPGVAELQAYEQELNRIAGRPAATVICAYDARQQSWESIDSVVDAHDAVFVGPGERAAAHRQHAATIRGQAARRRILDAASVLFSENGVGRTGVDALIEAANVAKATFYRQFPTKDVLVDAWLRDNRTRWFDEVRRAAEAGASGPSEIVPRIFDATAAWLEAVDFLGCPYLNTALELSGLEETAAGDSRRYIDEIGEYLRDLVRATGRPDADRVALAIHGLLAGSIVLAVAARTTAHAESAREAARLLLVA